MRLLHSSGMLLLFSLLLLAFFILPTACSRKSYYERKLIIDSIGVQTEYTQGEEVDIHLFYYSGPEECHIFDHIDYKIDDNIISAEVFEKVTKGDCPDIAMLYDRAFILEELPIGQYNIIVNKDTDAELSKILKVVASFSPYERELIVDSIDVQTEYVYGEDVKITLFYHSGSIACHTFDRIEHTINDSTIEAKVFEDVISNTCSDVSISYDRAFTLEDLPLGNYNIIVNKDDSNEICRNFTVQDTTKRLF